MKQWLFIFILLLFAGLLVNAQTGEVTPESTEIAPEATFVLEDPLLGIPVLIPMEMSLPEGWELILRDTYLYQDLVEGANGAYKSVPLDVYSGPLSNGAEGWIVVVWGYDSVVTVNDLNQSGSLARIAWLDGLRLLQLIVFDVRCNIGTAPQRDYSVGGLPASGTTFSAVDCPEELPDTRGWFATLKVDGLNFAFFVYADPIQPAGSPVEFELQAILDAVDFKVDEITISQEEYEATLQAVITPEATEAGD